MLQALLCLAISGIMNFPMGQYSTHARLAQTVSADQGSKKSLYGGMKSQQAICYFPTMTNLQPNSTITRTPLILCCGLALCSTIAMAQQMEVKVIDRQESETEYTYQPGIHLASASTSAANTTTARPAKFTSFQVSGATLSLQLPDGRVAVVNCDSKFQPRLAGQTDRRSCRTPPIDEIKADFKGSNAKLSWPISVDGKKVQSETYRILGVIPKPVEQTR